MHRHNYVGMLMILALLAAYGTREVGAAPITIAITAEVATVEDPGGMLAGAITVGDVITGTYVYDSSTLDTNAASTVGDYWHTTAPFGITINAGGLVFRTDPTQVNFLVEIVNDHGTPPRDNYLLRSYTNLFDVSTLPAPGGHPADDHIAWQLDDPTLAALASTALPTDAPTVAAWQSVFGLTIESRNAGGDWFFVRAHVTSAERLCAKSQGRKKCPK